MSIEVQLIILKLLFSVSLFMILYIYFGYPVITLLLSRIIRKNVKKGPYEPNLTILIAAHNEEEYIGKTLWNKLSLDYPKEKMEIIVVSDGSDDKTDDIVRIYEQQGVKLLRQEPRAGKTKAINMAVAHAKGEILIFSDANSMYAPDALASWCKPSMIRRLDT